MCHKQENYPEDRKDIAHGLIDRWRKILLNIKKGNENKWFKNTSLELHVQFRIQFKLFKLILVT